jgi:signal peptidase II
MAEPAQMHEIQSKPRPPLVTRGAIVAYVVALVVIGLDQAAKWWILNVIDLDHRPAIQVLPFFDLQMVWNQGVSYGLLRADSDVGRWLLVAFALGMTAVLAYVARGVRRPAMVAILGLIMGGAVGNVIDRIRFGAVADFLDFHALYFPWVFNVADSAISIGVILFLLDSFLSPKSKPAA